MDVGVDKAVGFKERLQSFVNLKRIDKEQPSRDGGPVPMTGPELKELQKEQIKAAFAKGSFTVNSESVEEYTDFLKKLNPRPWARLRAEIWMLYTIWIDKRTRKYDAWPEPIFSQKQNHPSNLNTH